MFMTFIIIWLNLGGQYVQSMLLILECQNIFRSRIFGVQVSKHKRCQGSNNQINEVL